MTKAKQVPVKSTGPLPRVVKPEVVRVLDMIDGRTMVVYMNNDGRIHQEVFADKKEAQDRAHELEESKK
jgi:hypothetical protein